ncbi:hypothetical protein J6590_045402 [Homalodisca vitripennis]|nr:hypothetical protein J6590_045402 [Homalodisca vitripennis]
MKLCSDCSRTLGCKGTEGQALFQDQETGTLLKGYPTWMPGMQRPVVDTLQNSFTDTTYVLAD